MFLIPRETSVTKAGVLSENRMEHRNGGNGGGVVYGTCFELEVFVLKIKVFTYEDRKKTYLSGVNILGF